MNGQNKIRVQIFERTCTLTGIPSRIQYAVNDCGVVFSRRWQEPVIRFKNARGGHFSEWHQTGRHLPSSAQLTNGYAVVLRGHCGLEVAA